MKPDWDELGEAYENSKKVIIGDVDCTAAGEPLCKRFGIEGYPTLKYFVPGGAEEGEPYEGGRTLKEMKQFVKKDLKPPCTAERFEKCSKKEQEAIKPYMEIPRDELETQYSTMKKALDEKKEAHDALMKSLQEQYEKSNKEYEELKKESQPVLKLMKAVLGPAKKPEPAAKDEV